MYNDEAPPKTLSMSHGHTKGQLTDLIKNDASFLWLCAKLANSMVLPVASGVKMHVIM